MKQMQPQKVCKSIWKAANAIKVRRAPLVMALLLTATLGGATWGSAANVTADANQDGPRQLSLDDAIGLGLRNNPAIELARLQAEKSRVAYEQADDAASGIDHDRVVSLEQALLKELAPLRTRLFMEDDEKAVADTQAAIRLSVTQAYFAAQLSHNLLSVKQKALEAAEQQLAMAQSGFKAGTRARLDVLTAEAARASAQAEASSAEKDYKVSIMNLNKAIGLPLSTELQLTTPLEEGAPPEIDLEAALVSAQQTNLDLSRAAHAVSAAKLNRDITGRYYTPNTYVYRQADAEYRQALARLDSAQREVEFKVRKGYLEVLDAYQRIHQQQKAVEAAAEGVRLAELRYRSGLGTMAEVLDAQARASGARAALAAAIYSYNMAIASLDNLTGGKAVPRP